MINKKNLVILEVWSGRLFRILLHGFIFTSGFQRCWTKPGNRKSLWYGAGALEAPRQEVGGRGSPGRGREVTGAPGGKGRPQAPREGIRGSGASGGEGRSPAAGRPRRVWGCERAAAAGRPCAPARSHRRPTHAGSQGSWRFIYRLSDSEKGPCAQLPRRAVCSAAGWVGRRGRPVLGVERGAAFEGAVARRIPVWKTSRHQARSVTSSPLAAWESGGRAGARPPHAPEAEPPKGAGLPGPEVQASVISQDLFLSYFLFLSFFSFQFF